MAWGVWWLQWGMVELVLLVVEGEKLCDCEQERCNKKLIKNQFRVHLAFNFQFKNSILDIEWKSAIILVSHVILKTEYDIYLHLHGPIKDIFSLVNMDI